VQDCRAGLGQATAWNARWLVQLLASAVLAGCAAPRYTTDDGRKVNEELLAQIRHYGAGERAIRPAIVRSSALADPDCDKQWELPFSVATSESWASDDRVAWVRALGVDERLTVVAAAATSPLQAGERIVEIDGHTFDVPPSDHMLVITNDDRPGVIGTVGTILGEALVNIADMDVGRAATPGTAVMLIAPTAEVPDEVVTALRAAPGIISVDVLRG